MNYLQTFLELDQPIEEIATRLRIWLLWIISLLVVITAVFAVIWFVLDRMGFTVPSTISSLVTIGIYGIGLWLAWRNQLWQSALLITVWFIFATTITVWTMPDLNIFAVPLYTLSLLFVSIFLSRRVLALSVTCLVFLYTGLFISQLRYQTEFAGFDWMFVTPYFTGLIVFVLAYALIRLNIEANGVRAETIRRSELHYRTLFAKSPIALWEQDGSAVMALVAQLQAKGVDDFPAYFEQNPDVLQQAMQAVKVLNVNETAVSLYNAQDRSELMANIDRLMPEESYSFVRDSLAAMAQGEPYFEREIKSQTLTGEKLTVLFRWVVSPEQENQYMSVITSIIDLTARKEVENALQNRTERLSGLHELDLALNTRKSPEEISGIALGFVMQFVPGWGAEVWVYDGEAQFLSRLAMTLREGGGERPFTDATQPVASMISKEIQDAMQDSLLYMVDDLQDLRYLPPYLTTLKQQGVRSFLQIPLTVLGDTIGFLNIYDKRKGSLTTDYANIAREFAAPLAIALKNVQLFVAERVARTQAEILRRVAAELNTNLELAPLLEHILDHLKEVIPYDSATIFLEQDGILRIVSQRDLPRNLDFEEIEANGELIHVNSVFTSEQPCIVPDTKKSSQWQHIPGLDHIRCWLGVPLQVKGKTLGVLTLDKSVARFYTENNQELAMAFANQAAIAIENARLYQHSLDHAQELEVRVDQRTRDLLTLYEITAVATKYLKLDKIIHESLKILLETLDCFSGSLFIKGDDGIFRLENSIGIPESVLPFVSAFENEDGSLNQILDDPKPLFIRDLADALSLSPLQLPKGVFSYAGVSIRVKNDVIGILSVIHDAGNTFSTEDFALLGSVADQFGVMIENGRLRQQNQEMAVLKERERMARELHDSVSQSLYSLTLFAAASRELSYAGSRDKLREYLNDIATTSQQALKEMRLMLYELRRGALGEEGLVNALRYRLEAVEGRSGIDANIEAQLDIDVPAGLRRTLYLIAQEALNNTLKHAKATQVNVTLGMEDTTLFMTIADNGRGFSPETINMGGLGLDSMRERIEEKNGRFEVISELGKGTIIKVRVVSSEL